MLVSNDDGYDEDEMRDLIAERFNTLEFKRMKESDMSSGKGDNKRNNDGDSASDSASASKTGRKGKTSKKVKDASTKKKKVDGYKLFMWGENKDGEVSKVKASDNFKDKVESDNITPTPYFLEKSTLGTLIPFEILSDIPPIRFFKASCEIANSAAR